MQNKRFLEVLKYNIDIMDNYRYTELILISSVYMAV